MRNLILTLICFLAFSVQAAESEEINFIGDNITINTAIGTSLQAYVAGPEDSNFGILILHDRWGVNDTIREWVDRFAAKGYRALAIEVFDGRISEKMWLATEIMGATDPEAAKTNVKAGLSYLKRGGRKVVTLGAGFGGWQSFQAAVASPNDVAATVVIYGLLEASVDQARSLQAPLLTLYAVNDDQITSNMIEEYRLLIKKSLIVHRTYLYPAGHGFMEPLDPNYNAQITDQVWGQIDEFLLSFVES